MTGMLDKILRPCEKVTIDGTEYVINTDFSVWIEIGERFLGKRGTGVGAVAEILALAYPVLPENPVSAIEKVLWFYRCGEVERKSATVGIGAPVFDFKRDFAYIWASFLGEFGIDISVVPMHWWKFRALLASLGEDCRFSKIMTYRSVDTSSVKDKNMKRFYENMKRKYRLPDIRTEREKELDTILKLESFF